MIDHLPQDSFFVEAIADDEEYALQTALQPKQDQSPRLSEWSAEAALLAMVVDRLGLLASMLAQFGKSRLSLPPVERPMTATERMRTRVSQTRHKALVAKLLPERTD